MWINIRGGDLKHRVGTPKESVQWLRGSVKFKNVTIFSTVQQYGGYYSTLYKGPRVIYKESVVHSSTNIGHVSRFCILHVKVLHQERDVVFEGLICFRPAQIQGTII